MAFEPHKITKDHVIKAAELIDQAGGLMPSTRHAVIINGKAYPPKKIMRYAHQVMNGQKVWQLSGGPPTNKYLEDLGFTIGAKNDSTADPIAEIIKRYKEYIKQHGSDDEIYKWRLIKKFQDEFNLDAPDFYSMIKSLDFYNLIYPNSRAVLNHLAEARPTETKQLFELLYNENIPLEERLARFRKGAEDIYNEIKTNPNHSAFQEERAMATYLAFRYPDKYSLYKESFYSQLCDALNEPKAEVGKKYLHYLNLVNGIREEYIASDQELISFVTELLDDKCYKDLNYTILTQDVLYVVLDKSGKKKRYWRVGCRDDDSSYWDVMRDNDFIGFDWSRLGDLNQVEGLTRNKLIEDRIDVYKGNKNVASRKAGQILQFFDEIAIDDHVVVCDGKQVVGIGVVTGPYYFLNNDSFPHRKPVKWLFKDIENKQISEGLLTTIYRLSQYNTIQILDSILNSTSIPTITNNVSMPLNTILFGPPGTGKTYSTILQAASIATGAQFESHDEAKREFDRLRKDGQIEFITFHQNYGYEDFIIGIKPDLDGNELGFRRHEGVFYKICKKAEENYLQHITGKTYVEPSFEEVLDEFLAPLVDQEIELATEAKGFPFSITANNGKNLSFRKKSGGTGHTLSIASLKEIYEGAREVMPEGIWIYFRPIVNQLKETAKTLRRETGKMELKNYVLIIDEINRANISKVFGELITLLEEDKRIGSSNELRVSLPNGDRTFGVPPNLFILGTMNTADKSIAHIDVALRRRFDFIAMYPDPNLLEGRFREVLIALNEGILGIKKSPDFTIGHAFFMNEDEKSLMRIMKHKILPLLNEYFMGRGDIIKEILEGAGLSTVINSTTKQLDIIDALT